jgi:diaminopimelate decarboxylase
LRGAANDKAGYRAPKQINYNEGVELGIDWALLEGLATTYGESFYLLDSKKFEKNYGEFLGAFRDLYPKTFIAYSYKTNYIPKLCALVDCKGGYAEVVSDMEFDLATRLGISPQRIIFNGPYKSRKTIEKCLLGGGIVNLDSSYDIDIVERIARDKPEINLSIGIRCNFDIGDYMTSRFGFDIDREDFYHAFDRLKRIDNISIKGLHCHFANRSIESFITRVDKMLHLSTQLFSSPPELINLGGGFFGPMEESLEKQFNCKVPSYREYAEVIAGKLRRFYQNLAEPAKPKLLLEPGTALVADTMKFVVKVIDIKTIRNKIIATVSGSKLNIIPTSNVNLPIKVYQNPENCCCQEYNSIDIAGYTCMENDYLYRGYEGALAKGDFIVFDNVGSYSIVLKPPFILPNCAIIEYNSKKKSCEIIKRKEETQDIFGTFKF